MSALVAQDEGEKMKRDLTHKDKGSLLSLDNLSHNMKEKFLFNTHIEEEKIDIIFGDTTNLLVLEDVKFQWAKELYDHMISVRWTKEDINMSSDSLTYQRLTEEEKEGFDATLSFLAFLDSLQVNNLNSNVSSYITAPEVVGCFAEQTAIEFQHSYIYQHIFQSLKLKTQDILDIYYKWEHIPVLKERIEYISKLYQDFNDDPSFEKFIKALIADLLLEGLYFYNGFSFLYNLSARGLMMGTAGNIKLINKDELFHTVLFQNTIKEILKLCNPELTKYIYQILLEMVVKAVEQEITWSKLIYGDGKIIGITNETIEEYTNYLAYKNILKPIIMDEKLLSGTVYEEILARYKGIKNPYKYIDRIANLEGGESKNGFFENSNVDYLTVSVFSDFNSF